MTIANSKICFVISPIGEPSSSTRRKSDQVLRHIIRPAVEPAYRAVRADEIAEPGLITSQIMQHVIEDDLVISDLTDLNPNVLYELAVRHAILKPFVQIITKGQTIPFDVSGIRTVFFVNGGEIMYRQGGSRAEMWRLKSVPPVAFNQERPNLTEGGLDVQGGYSPPCSQGLFRRRDERPRGGPSVRATPGHGAQDARVLRAPRVSTATTGSQTEARSI